MQGAGGRGRGGLGVVGGKPGTWNLIHMAEIAKGEWEQRGREGKVLSFRDWLALGGCQRKERKSRSS